MLRITNRTNNPVFLGRFGISNYGSIEISDEEAFKVKSTITKLEKSNIITSVRIADQVIKKEVTSLTSETTKKGRKKSKKGENS